MMIAIGAVTLGELLLTRLVMQINLKYCTLILIGDLKKLNKLKVLVNEDKLKPTVIAVRKLHTKYNSKLKFEGDHLYIISF